MHPTPRRSSINGEHEISTKPLPGFNSDEGQPGQTSETGNTLVPNGSDTNDSAMEVNEDASSEVYSTDDLKVSSLLTVSFAFREDLISTHLD
jgi:hypothetical protein